MNELGTRSAPRIWLQIAPYAGPVVRPLARLLGMSGALALSQPPQPSDGELTRELPLHLLATPSQPRPRSAGRLLVLAFAAAIFVATPLLQGHPLLSLGSDSPWLLGLLGAVVLAVQWQLGGALVGMAVNLATFGVIEGWYEGWRDFARPEAQGVFIMMLLLDVSIPLAVGWLSHRLSHADDVRRLTEANLSVSRGAEAAVRASEERFRSLVQNASDIMVVLDANGNRRYLSPSITRVLGYQPAELVGTSFFASIHPDDTARVLNFHLEHLANPLVSAPIEFRCRDRAGSWHQLEAIFNNLLRDPSVGGVVVNVRDITERKRFEERLTHQAFHDPLTGLPNRTLFMERLEHALARRARHGRPVAMMFLDLDRFKVINDSLGHAVGDALLIGVGERLAECIRPGDTVARLGGDEFAILVEEMEQLADVTTVAERIIERFRQPMLLEGHEVFVATSLGIAASSDETANPADLLRDADVALYQAKAAGRGCYVVFDPCMNARALERLDLETDLRRAIERGQLRLHYQPEVDILTGTITGMEALVRWQHPAYGLMAPDRFIPLSEETGLILPIGAWVLGEACRQAVAWQALRPDGPPLVMGVNLSVLQLQQPDLVDQVAKALRDTGLAPECLRLEITETVAMRNIDATIRTLRALKLLGVDLALDDFGTGYSSLSYLRRLNVDTVKVDRSFVQELTTDTGTAAIVLAVTTLAHSLGMKVIAEGIETAEQLAGVQAVNCDRVQGYYYSRPRPAHRLATALQNPDSDGQIVALYPELGLVGDEGVFASAS